MENLLLWVTLISKINNEKVRKEESSTNPFAITTILVCPLVKPHIGHLI